ncbi:MAG: EAL domain-containing protein [Lachnospiraceae bacterium]|nr:EAL domain-containing protein [Lachnospiraceae bacterium]
MTHKEKAIELLKKKYHCSQALLGAFAGDFGLDLKTAFKISTCFGGGMRQGTVCGCITGGLMVLGLAFGFTDPQDKELETYGNRKTEEYIRAFQDKMQGDVFCRDILGKDISKPEEMAIIRQEGLILQKCPRAFSASIEILEKMLAEYTGELLNVDMEDINISEDEEIKAMLKNMSRRQRFRRNVRNLLNETRQNVAFIQFDIRRFKIINDLYGEQFGDEVLYWVREKLKSFCNARQFFVNLRSDVFQIVTEYNEVSELYDLIGRLEEELGIYKAVKLQYSSGVYLVEDVDMELRQMEDRAGMARKAAKNSLLSEVVFYQEQFKASLYNRKFVEDNIDAAIKEGQLQMYLQPKYSISQNRIIGAEALVRWRHPKKGMIFPAEFLPVIEEDGFITKVDYYMWRKAAEFLQKCQKVGIEDCPVSANLSRRHLQDREFIRVLERIVEENGICKQLLELEITETMEEHVSQAAREIKDQGFKLLMDDFGSGYSSLNILLETPFDVLKLDRKFMENMMVSDKGRLILEHIITMAEQLKLGLIAEGVETREQVDMLKQMGCDQVQGYYYAKPMPEEEFYKLLLENRSEDCAQED